MDNKFIQKSLDNTSSKLQKSLRSFDMTAEKFWLMKSERDKLLLGSQGIDIFYSNFTQTFTLKILSTTINLCFLEVIYKT